MQSNKASTIDLGLTDGTGRLDPISALLAVPAASRKRQRQAAAAAAAATSATASSDGATASSDGASAAPAERLTGKKRKRDESSTPSPSVTAQSSSFFLQLSRITITAAAHHVRYLQSTSSSGDDGAALQAILSTYDIVVIQPEDGAALKAALACPWCDCIRLDLSGATGSGTGGGSGGGSGGKPPLSLTPADVAAAAAAGIMFEVDYSSAISDASMRRYFIRSLGQLLRLTRGGRGVLLTSGAKEALEMRAPLDAAAVAYVAGMKQPAALHAMSTAAAAVLKRAEARLTTGGSGSGSGSGGGPVLHISPPLDFSGTSGTWSGGGAASGVPTAPLSRAVWMHSKEAVTSTGAASGGAGGSSSPIPAASGTVVLSRPYLLSLAARGLLPRTGAASASAADSGPRWALTEPPAVTAASAAGPSTGR